MSRRGMALAALLVLAVACGGKDTTAPDVITAGQVDIKLPPGWTVTSNGARRPAAPAASATDPAAPTGAATADTVPLAKTDPTTDFFKSTASFTQCLKDRGTSFIGIPDQTKPDSPANDPTYLKDLQTCAAKSNILQTMQGFQKAQDNLTPAEVKEQNKGYLRWRTCMIGRGWDIAKPKPDAKGRLFSINPNTGSAFKPPPGEDLLTSGDLQACAAETQAPK